MAPGMLVLTPQMRSLTILRSRQHALKPIVGKQAQ